ncbi:MAG: hypothetical protein IPL52_17260 [Flavobacteriales bacterium]|nr:hypothetical protein [Flavobacteriales bacterium]
MNILPALVSLIAVPQPSGPVRWSTEASVASDGSVRVEIVAHCEEGWHIYATELPSDQGPLPTVFRFTPSSAYASLGALQEPKAVEEFDENFGVQVRHHSGEARFLLSVKPVISGAFSVEGEVEYMACNGSTCLPPVSVPFKIDITP